MKRRLWFIGLTVAVFAMIASGSLVSAAKPAEFTASGLIAVIGMSDPVPAGASGRVRIESETIASTGPITSDSPQLAGAVLSLNQRSNELFSSADLSEAVVINGNSTGAFDVVDPATGEVIASGRYQARVSNIPGVCQIYNQGNWSSTGNSGLKGRGQMSACLNFDPAYGTFVGQVSLNGTLN